MGIGATHKPPACKECRGGGVFQGGKLLGIINGEANDTCRAGRLAVQYGFEDGKFLKGEHEINAALQQEPQRLQEEETKATAQEKTTPTEQTEACGMSTSAAKEGMSDSGSSSSSSGSKRSSFESLTSSVTRADAQMKSGLALFTYLSLDDATKPEKVSTPLFSAKAARPFYTPAVVGYRRRQSSRSRKRSVKAIRKNIERVKHELLSRQLYD